MIMSTLSAENVRIQVEYEIVIGSGLMNAGVYINILDLIQQWKLVEKKELC